MCTIEVVKAEIEKSPFLKQLLEKQLECFFPLWIQSKIKERTISRMVDENKNFLFQTVILLNISDSDVNKYIETEKYKEIKEIYDEYLNGELIKFDTIHKLFLNNVKKVCNDANQLFIKYKKEHLKSNKVKKQVEDLEKKGQYSIINKIYSKYYKNDERLKQCTVALNVLLKTFDIRTFDVEKLKRNQSLIGKLIVTILRPDLLIPVDFTTVLNGEKLIPGDWYLKRKLSVAEYRDLIHDAESEGIWKKLYKETKESILLKAKLPLLPVRRRKNLIQSIFVNIEKHNYDSAMIIIFPIIEGLLWDFTSLVNKTESLYVKKDTFIDIDTAEEFVTNRIREVIGRTSVNKYLDQDFIAEFCNELYEERNPVLHGNMVCSEDCKDFAVCFIKKLFVLDYVMEVFVEVQKNIIFKNWDEMFSEDKIDGFIQHYETVVAGV